VRAELTTELIPANESTFFANDLRRLVQQEGLRAMVAAMGLTGTSYLELDYLDPKRNPALDVPWTPRVVYVPSAQSTFNRIGTAAERVFQRLDQLQIEQLIADLDIAMVAVTKAVHEADIGAVSHETTKLLADVRATSGSLRNAIESADVPQLQKNIDDVMNRLAGTVERLELVVTSQGGNLDAIMSELRETTRHMRELSEVARSNPSSILFSDPPQPVVLPRREEP
jgi:phospholipid/cholesterol/gamma-HCH transport system substrate-binding protein/paraquat-inducible protein B